MKASDNMAGKRFPCIKKKVFFSLGNLGQNDVELVGGVFGPSVEYNDKGLWQLKISGI